MSIYAVEIEKTDSAITICGSRPVGLVYQFENKAAFNAAQSRRWAGDRFEGKNLIRVSLARVRNWFGRNFVSVDFVSVGTTEKVVRCEWDG